MSRGERACNSCGGTRQVLSPSYGELRPCSRCDSAAFGRWADANRPKRREAPPPDAVQAVDALLRSSPTMKGDPSERP